jgi:CDP-4-dehydro-6-deoxyglucose reductase, E3
MTRSIPSSMQNSSSILAELSSPSGDDLLMADPNAARAQQPIVASSPPTTTKTRQLTHGQVARVDRPTSGVTILSVRVDIDTPFSYIPGQYINVLGADGRFRSYSLARADALDGCIELHIGRVPGGFFSDEAMSRIRPGDPLSWLGPYGDFAWRSDAGKHAIFICTGTGFAPVRALLETVLATAADTSVVLYWGGRKLSDLYARALVQSWARAYPNFRFIPVLSEGLAIEGSSIRRGFVHQAVMDDMPSLDDAMVYACGSPKMVSAARQTFVEQRGLPAHVFFADPFGEAESTPAPGSSESEAAQVQIDVDGVEYTVRAEGSLLQALKRAGVPIQSVCGGQGACGTCLIEIDTQWHDRIAAPKDQELDLLAFTPDAVASCRLACRIPMDPSMNGLAVRVR